MHTTALDQHWGSYEKLKLVLVHVAWLFLSQCLNVCNSASPYLMDLRGLLVTKNEYFPLLIPTKQLLLVTLCDTTAGIGNSKVGHLLITLGSQLSVGREIFWSVL